MKKPLTELSKHHLAEMEIKLLDQLSSYEDPIAKLSQSYDKAVTVEQVREVVGAVRFRPVKGKRLDDYAQQRRKVSEKMQGEAAGRQGGGGGMFGM